MMKRSILFGVLTGLVCFHGAWAQSAVKKGLEIAQKVDSSDDGYVSQVSDVEMILRNRTGKEAKRQLIIKQLEVKGDGDKSLTLFKSPQDVKGTAFLSHSKVKGSDQQWLYMPALRRVKRIAAARQNGSFMGSEFSYEDLSSQELEKFSYKYLRAEKVNGLPGHVYERVPVNKSSGYKRQVVWVDAKAWRIWRVDYFDRKNELLKTLKYVDYKKYPRNQWRATRMEMKNHQTGKSTDLIWKSFDFNKKLSQRDFQKNALKRLR